MSFDLKVSLQQRSEPSAQQKKLNRLIDKIEQQKVSLSTWQNAQAEIQQHIRQKLMPVYNDLHIVLSEQMAAQSLKTVYLKIAAMIHPDREQDETKKLEKTELFQQASQAYEKQDLFYLLKLQLQLEQNKGLGAKELSAEQLRFYKLALDAQSQQLESQIAEILDSFQLAKNVKAEHVHISDVYKAVDADCAELKQQVKWEKERLKHMKKVRGVEMLLGHGVL
ncbi:hypothetical protein [Acinetobacter baumannii]|uniref:hypothetical protein n=1 Tax=Acinetobacter baumannii TaxID=470 RepID=UPI0002BB710C|nr:hypothetical protein [Acinetobacter baumannii]EJA9989277.1 hypothetical protein [Acinetobacter baumannii]EJC1498984.1 hypothetical protein [Acinetobacter baumannii]EJC8093185.1 hypothetical protein [Acinetobacter baumannii]EJG9675679.1 hypothetical protein [Acinetobacter baumannii]EJK2177835.1 hypothetical protein [Acinetobacter baumannii]